MTHHKTHTGRGALRSRVLATGLAALTVGWAAAVAAGDGASSASIDPGAWIRDTGANFSISAGEVTVAQYRACVGAKACDAKDVDPLCNYGRAGRDAHPVNCVNFTGAEQYCKWAGGRLCTEDEWMQACRGSDGHQFPYGETFDPDACNVHSNQLAVAGGTFDTSAVGATSTCEGGLPGLFDMGGNVGEWVNTCKGAYCKFRGAGYLSNDPIDHFTACGGVCSGNQKTLKSNVVGIRCCRDEAH